MSRPLRVQYKDADTLSPGLVERCQSEVMDDDRLKMKYKILEKKLKNG